MLTRQNSSKLLVPFHLFFCFFCFFALLPLPPLCCAQSKRAERRYSTPEGWKRINFSKVSKPPPPRNIFVFAGRLRPRVNMSRKSDLQFHVNPLFPRSIPVAAPPPTPAPPSPPCGKVVQRSGTLPPPLPLSRFSLSTLRH